MRAFAQLLAQHRITTFINRYIITCYEYTIPPFHGGNTGSNPGRVAERANPRKSAPAKDLHSITAGLHQRMAIAVLVAFCHFLRLLWPTWPVLPLLGIAAAFSSWATYDISRPSDLKWLLAGVQRRETRLLHFCARTWMRAHVTIRSVHGFEACLLRQWQVARKDLLRGA
jgi:hypothetical protein